MSKILISFLGTGPSGKIESREYRKADYKIDDKNYSTSFVAAAISEHYNIEKKIVLGTCKSMWEEYYRYFAEKTGILNTDFYVELGEFSEKANHTNVEFPFKNQLEEILPDTEIIILKYGLDQEELTYNLEKILSIDNLLTDGDEIIIDVTHGFRSFPLFAQQIIMYLKLVSNKKIIIDKFFYGMLDATKELGYTPVVDLSIIQNMNEWIIGASNLINKSDGTDLVPLLEKKDKNLAEMVDNFSKALNINYSYDIKEQYKKVLASDFSKLDALERMIAVKSFDEFKSHFKNMDRSHSLFQLDLAKWYYKKNLYGVSYLTLTEAIITYAAETVNPSNCLDKADRDYAKSNMNEINKELYKLYKSVNGVRKNVAHMLSKRNSLYKDDIRRLKDYLRRANIILGNHIYNKINAD